MSFADLQGVQIVGQSSRSRDHSVERRLGAKLNQHRGLTSAHQYGLTSVPTEEQPETEGSVAV